MLQTFAALLLFKYFSICSTNNNSRFQVHLVLIGPYLYWQERGRAWSQISRHEENMEFYNYLLFIPSSTMKKSAKNCTLYHVVNKYVWADIGAANQLAPIYWCYLCWQHQYIGATCDGSTNRRRHTDILQLYNFFNVWSTNILVLTG